MSTDQIIEFNGVEYEPTVVGHQYAYGLNPCDVCQLASECGIMITSEECANLIGEEKCWKIKEGGTVCN